MRDQDNEVWEDMKVKGVFWEKVRFTLVSEVLWKKTVTGWAQEKKPLSIMEMTV